MPEPDPAQRLRRVYLFALMSVAALTLLAHVGVQLALADRRQDSHEVNLAGRQRMLSQRIHKAALLQASGRGDPNELRSSLAEWRRVHEALLGVSPLEEIRPLPAELSAEVRRLRPAAERFERAAQTALDEGPGALGELELAAPPFLEAMNHVVYALDAYGAAKLSQLQSVVLGLCTLILAVLLIEALFVFEPVVGGLRESLARIAALDDRAQLSDELARSTTKLSNANEALMAREWRLEKRNEQLGRTVAELEEANRLQRDLVAVVSHEFRTPLHAVLSYCDLIELSPSLDDKSRTRLTKLRAAGRQLLELVEDLLGFARLQSGREEARAEVVDLEELRAQVFAGLEPLVKEGVTLEAVIEQEHELVSDGLKLRQILQNLISNALKFTERGHVRATLRTSEGQLELSVEDTGCGIPSDQLDLVFEPFRQANGSNTRVRGGTGLGLAIVKEAAALLGGEVNLESQLGQGSTFRLRFPLRPEGALLAEERFSPSAAASTQQASDAVWLIGELGACAAALRSAGLEVEQHPATGATVGRAAEARPRALVIDAATPALTLQSFLTATRNQGRLAQVPLLLIGESVPPGVAGIAATEWVPDAERLIDAIAGTSGCERVILVEDDPACLNLTRATLESAGYEVEAYTGGQEALERLVRLPRPQALVLDLRLPDLSGFELLARLSEEEGLREVPKIMFSAAELRHGECLDFSLLDAFVAKTEGNLALLETLRQHLPEKLSA